MLSILFNFVTFPATSRRPTSTKPPGAMSPWGRRSFSHVQYLLIGTLWSIFHGNCQTNSQDHPDFYFLTLCLVMSPSAVRISKLLNRSFSFIEWTRKIRVIMNASLPTIQITINQDASSSESTSGIKVF